MKVEFQKARVALILFICHWT